MNERIKELAEQSGYGARWISTEQFEQFMEKFAEVIVRECAKVAFDDWCEGTNEASSQMAILKHFGVEE